MPGGLQSLGSQRVGHDRVTKYSTITESGFHHLSLVPWLNQIRVVGKERSPAQVGCMRHVLGPGALVRSRGFGWSGRWEGGIRMGNTCKPMAVSFQCMTKSTTIKKIIIKKTPSNQGCICKEKR